MGLKPIKSERVIMVDIDDTLVMHGRDKNVPDAVYVDVLDTLYDDTFIKMQVNAPMVRLVREEIVRGSKIIFWSRGGYQWAMNVLTALHFDEYETELLVLTKPFAYFDDSPVDKWMVDRVYIKPDVPYKI